MPSLTVLLRRSSVGPSLSEALRRLLPPPHSECTDHVMDRVTLRGRVAAPVSDHCSVSEGRGQRGGGTVDACPAEFEPEGANIDTY